jgi:hypothetical protein
MGKIVQFERGERDNYIEEPELMDKNNVPEVQKCTL